jgi:hypothetical protein
MASAVPWPDAGKPPPAPLAHPPAETDPRSRFHGYDAMVMTWTAAEAATLAGLQSPEFLPSQWCQYRHGIETYVPLVTGAPPAGGRCRFNGAAVSRRRRHGGTATAGDGGTALQWVRRLSTAETH